MGLHRNADSADITSSTSCDRVSEFPRNFRTCAVCRPRNTKYKIRNTKYRMHGSWPRPRPRIWHFGDSGCGYNNSGSGCKLRLCRAPQFHFHGSYGRCGCDLHSASQFVFSNSAGAWQRTRTRMRMRTRIRTRLGPPELPMTMSHSGMNINSTGC